MTTMLQPLSLPFVQPLEVGSQDETIFHRNVYRCYLRNVHDIGWSLKRQYVIGHPRMAAFERDSRDNRQIRVFTVETTEASVQSIVANGLECRTDPITKMSVGEVDKGVTTFKHPDLLMRWVSETQPNVKEFYLITYKLSIGRVRYLNANELYMRHSPNIDYDIFMSDIKPHETEEIAPALLKSVVYSYEMGADGAIVRHPRHLIPACITVCKAYTICAPIKLKTEKSHTDVVAPSPTCSHLEMEEVNVNESVTRDSNTYIDPVIASESNTTSESIVPDTDNHDRLLAHDQTNIIPYLYTNSRNSPNFKTDDVAQITERDDVAQITEHAAYAPILSPISQDYEEDLFQIIKADIERTSVLTHEISFPRLDDDLVSCASPSSTPCQDELCFTSTTEYIDDPSLQIVAENNHCIDESASQSEQLLCPSVICGLQYETDSTSTATHTDTIVDNANDCLQNNEEFEEMPECDMNVIFAMLDARKSSVKTSLGKQSEVKEKSNFDSGATKSKVITASQKEHAHTERPRDKNVKPDRKLFNSYVSLKRIPDVIKCKKQRKQKLKTWKRLRIESDSEFDGEVCVADQSESYKNDILRLDNVEHHTNKTVTSTPAKKLRLSLNKKEKPKKSTNLLGEYTPIVKTKIPHQSSSDFEKKRTDKNKGKHTNNCESKVHTLPKSKTKKANKFSISNFIKEDPNKVSKHKQGKDKITSANKLSTICHEKSALNDKYMSNTKDKPCSKQKVNPICKETCLPVSKPKDVLYDVSEIHKLGIDRQKFTISDNKRNLIKGIAKSLSIVKDSAKSEKSMADKSSPVIGPKKTKSVVNKSLKRENSKDASAGKMQKNSTPCTNYVDMHVSFPKQNSAVNSVTANKTEVKPKVLKSGTVKNKQAKTSISKNEVTKKLKTSEKSDKFIETTSNQKLKKLQHKTNDKSKHNSSLHSLAIDRQSSDKQPNSKKASVIDIRFVSHDECSNSMNIQKAPNDMEPNLDTKKMSIDTSKSKNVKPTNGPCSNSLQTNISLNTSRQLSMDDISDKENVHNAPEENELLSTNPILELSNNDVPYLENVLTSAIGISNSENVQLSTCQVSTKRQSMTSGGNVPSNNIQIFNNLVSETDKQIHIPNKSHIENVLVSPDSSDTNPTATDSVKIQHSNTWKLTKIDFDVVHVNHIEFLDWHDAKKCEEKIIPLSPDPMYAAYLCHPNKEFSSENLTKLQEIEQTIKAKLKVPDQKEKTFKTNNKSVTSPCQDNSSPEDTNISLLKTRNTRSKPVTSVSTISSVLTPCQEDNHTCEDMDISPIVDSSETTLDLTSTRRSLFKNVFSDTSVTNTVTEETFTFSDISHTSRTINFEKAGETKETEEKQTCPDLATQSETESRGVSAEISQITKVRHSSNPEYNASNGRFKDYKKNVPIQNTSTMEPSGMSDQKRRARRRGGIPRPINKIWYSDEYLKKQNSQVHKKEFHNNLEAKHNYKGAPCPPIRQFADIPYNRNSDSREHSPIHPHCYQERGHRHGAAPHHPYRHASQYPERYHFADTPHSPEMPQAQPQCFDRINVRIDNFDGYREGFSDYEYGHRSPIFRSQHNTYQPHRNHSPHNSPLHHGSSLYHKRSPFSPSEHRSRSYHSRSPSYHSSRSPPHRSPSQRGIPHRSPPHRNHSYGRYH